jgi:hypothetical protein
MVRVIRAGQLKPSRGGTITFHGEPYGSGVSFFLVNNVPGAGPDLYRHHDSETWIVRRGKARFTAGGEELEVGPGGIVVVAAETPLGPSHTVLTRAVSNGPSAGRDVEEVVPCSTRSRAGRR